MTHGDKQKTSDVLRILHGANPAAREAAEALRPLLESMRKNGSGDALARASIAAPPWGGFQGSLSGLGTDTGTGRVRCLIPILLFGGFGYAHL